ncbi:MAG TPA: cache domain-containing protein [Terriglobales bacterium]
MITAAVGFLVLAGFDMKTEHTRMLDEKRQQAQTLTDLAYGLIVHQYQLEVSGAISRAEAQERAVTAIQAMRYQNGNYYWVIRLDQPTVVTNAARPDLDGQDLSNYPDPRGKAVLAEFIKVARQHGSGFVSYYWPQPGEQKPVPKLSFVKAFVPWGWIVGTGIYMDDLDIVWRDKAISAGLVAAISMTVLLIVSLSISSSIFTRLHSVVERMRSISEGHGDFPGRIQSVVDTESVFRHVLGGRDEVSMLVDGFNRMLGEIRKRDARLQQHERFLEQEVHKRTADLQSVNLQLEKAHEETEVFLEAMPSFLIGVDANGRIARWNRAAENIFGVSKKSVLGRPFADCGIKWLRADMADEIARWWKVETYHRCEDASFEKNQKPRFLGLHIRRIPAAIKESAGFVVTGADITDRKFLEQQVNQANRLEAVGQLAAGIAHEINTPTQYVADNTTFVKSSCEPIMQLLVLCQNMRHEAAAGPISPALLCRFDELVKACDLPYLEKELPNAIDQSLEGLRRISWIVKAMKEFSHPGSNEKLPLDINRAIETTITVARNEWKYVADVVTDLDPSLPSVPCLQGEFNQVILNLLVNAAHAIAGVVGDGAKAKGKITVATRKVDDSVEISIHDTGTGIPVEIQPRIFEPFFTTKPVGKGTGQGLSLAHSTVVKRHHGQIWFESAVGEGTTFHIRLPLEAHAIAATA